MLQASLYINCDIRTYIVWSVYGPALDTYVCQLLTISPVWELLKDNTLIIIAEALGLGGGLGFGIDKHPPGASFCACVWGGEGCVKFFVTETAKHINWINDILSRK